VRRREFITTSACIAALAVGSRAGLGQNRMFHIGYLASLAPESTPDLIGSFRQELKARGYMEGENLEIDYRWSALPSRALADELIQLRPEVIVAWATPAVTAAKQATTTVPIVMVGVSDPVATGFVASLSRPGGNITGTTNLARDLGGKTLELLIELVPTLTSINVLRNPRNPASTFQFPDIEAAALALKRKIAVLDVSNDTELEQAFARMRREGAQAVLALADPYLIEQRSRIARLARDARLPSIFSRRENVEGGGLLAYGPSLRAQFRETAIYVDRILKGEKPAELPVQQPTTFELVINVTTARALGLTIPPTLLERADEVIE